MNSNTTSEARVISLCFIVTLFIFWIDLITPLGVAVGVPYILVILFSLRSRLRHATYTAATLTSLLVILGWTLSPQGGEESKVIANRLMALLVIWCVAKLGLGLKQKTKSTSAFRGILDQTLNELYIFDVQSLHFVRVNSAARNNIGYTMQEIQGLTPLDIKPDYTQALLAELVAPLLDGTQDRIDFNTVHRRKDGSHYPVEIRLELSVIDDRPVFVALVLDITRQKQQEEQTASANYMAADADAANRAKSEFLANMSHEIRTPMTAILGFTDILLDNMVDQENINAVRTVKDNGEYLLKLINNILDLSKIEAGKLDVEQLDCSPHEIVAEVVSLMRVRAAAKNLSLNFRFDGPIPEKIQSDPTRFRQILFNLVGNAIKFTEVGSVEIVTRLLNQLGEEPKLQFEVIDTGIGVPEDKSEKLFLPFTQADGSTTRKFGGTGLGLAISKRMVELLGGNISVSSTAGKGSTFVITVATGPLDGVHLLHNFVESLDNNIDKKTDGTMATLLNRRILLVEDGPDNQRLIHFVLQKAGAEVTTADNGQIGFDLATAAKSESNPFDVILMDMQMPVLDGYEATKRLRNDGYSGPIIALTAHAMSSDRQRCLDSGCDDYATKPIDRKKLISLLGQYASQQERHQVSSA